MEARPVTHPSLDSLKAFALGRLDDLLAEAVMSHLEACVDCRDKVAAVSGDDFLDRLRQAHGLSHTPAPAQSLAAVARRLQAGHPVTPAPLLDLPPELVGHPQYEVVRELGRGGMGVVYLATNKLMQRPEVLKVMNKTLIDRDGAGERFLREIRSAARLNHPNVATAYTALQVGDLLVFAMEYVEGENLAQVVKARGPLPVVAACYYVQQAALGLQHAFENAMVHRDIKPQNLMVMRRHKRLAIKVLDFGLAKVLREKDQDTGLTGEGKMLGTPDYVAPEQITDAAHADIRADIYSLGGTLYYLLSGGPPFRAANLWELLQAHMSREVEPLDRVRSEVPVELAAVVAKMLAKDPAERYQTPVEVAQALVPFVKPGSKSADSAPGEKTELEASKGSQSSSGSTSGSRVAKEGKIQRPAKAEAKPPAAWDTRTDTSGTSTGPAQSAEPRQPRRPARRSTPRTKPVIAAVAAACVLVLVLAGLWASGVLRVKTKDGILVVEVDEPNPEVFVDGDKVTVTWDNGGKKAEIGVQPGTRKVEVKKDGFVVYGGEVEIQADGRTPFRARLEPLPVVAGGPKAPVKTPQGVPPPPLGPAQPGKRPAYVHGKGQWKIEGDELIQAAADEAPVVLLFGDASWTDYDVSLEAQRIEGRGLCGVGFRVKDFLNYLNFNLGTDGSQRLVVRTDGKYSGSVKEENREAGDNWHKIAVKVRGNSIKCFLDGEEFFDQQQDRHLQGFVTLATGKTATRFRSLKVVEASGRLLVGGVHDLYISDEQAPDKARKGSLWRGTVRDFIKGSWGPGRDVDIRIVKREGTRFSGEFRDFTRAGGLKIEGNIDPMGNISWTATKALPGSVGWSLENFGLLATGTLQGNRLRARVSVPNRDTEADLALTE